METGDKQEPVNIKSISERASAISQLRATPDTVIKICWPKDRWSSAIAVNASAELLQQASKVTSVAHRFCSPRSAVKQWSEMAAEYRWPLKTLLLLAAVVAWALLFPTGPSGYWFACLYFLTLAVPIAYDLIALEQHRSNAAQQGSGFSKGETPLWFGVAVVALTLPIALVCSYVASG